jgi:predicted transposase YbfD/YdcC
MSTVNYNTLTEALAQVPDPRAARGQRYEWLFLLVVVGAALMSGKKTLLDINSWVQAHGVELKTTLRPKKGRLPSLWTLRRVVCDVAITKLEEALSQFQVGLIEETGGAGTLVTHQGRELHGQALDGKTVRGASAHGDLIHLVSLVHHDSGLVLDQDKATKKLHERRVAEKLLARNDLRDTVITTDALHTCRKQAKQIRQRGGDYLFVVKRNQRVLYDDIAAAFTALPPKGTCETEFWQYEATTIHHRGHGRTETHILESTPALNHYLPFADVGLVVRRTRIAVEHSTQAKAVSVEYLITSLDRQRVTLDQIEQLRRGHWTIENVNHYARDVSFGEDRSQIRSGNAPQALAALRNAVAALLHVEGWTTLPAGFRYCERSPQIPLRLMGAIAT